MNMDVWHKIFKDYIKCYEGIELLRDNGVVDPEDSLDLKQNLLKEIIEVFREEVED